MVKNKTEEKKNRSRFTLQKGIYLGGKNLHEKEIFFFFSFSYLRVPFIICVKNHQE